MNTNSDLASRLRDRLLSIVCGLRGHDWAGARHHAAQADGLLLCVRCGLEDDGRQEWLTDEHPAGLSA